MLKNKRNQIFGIIKKHIENNIKEYIIVLIIFIIGIFLGVLTVNKTSDDQIIEITNYINTYIENLKNINNISNIELLQNSIIQNIIWAIVICFFGTTVIGIPIVLAIIMYRGFCLGYTISSFIVVLGHSKGTIFILTNLVLQNIFFIPAILALGVSGMKLYKSIIKDKKRENIKNEIVRHIIFSIFLTIILIVSSGIEILISHNLFKIIVSYF